MIYFVPIGVIKDTVTKMYPTFLGTKPSGRCFRGDRCGEVLLYVSFLLKKTGRKRWEGRLNECVIK